ncbi:MAG TPA: secondary thiamine-phosphate synthase enzyme YjbQ [Blastocatellia bacterium]|jgi:secondary thiamine-phosphate synthase enzyme
MKNLALSAVEARPRIETKEGTYKVASTTLIVTTDDRVELKTITQEIIDFVAQTPVREGVVQISSLHTTAGIMLNETQDALLGDMKAMFEQVVPRGVYYKHNDPLFSDCDRRNADAHLRAIVVGPSLSIPIENGKMKLGTWQQILFTEFDGPNHRKVHIQVMGI